LEKEGRSMRTNMNYANRDTAWRFLRKKEERGKNKPRKQGWEEGEEKKKNQFT